MPSNVHTVIQISKPLALQYLSWVSLLMEKKVMSISSYSKDYAWNRAGPWLFRNVCFCNPEWLSEKKAFTLQTP